MIFDTIESVLKQPLDNSQLENFRDALTNSKYARLSNTNNQELRLALGIEDNVKVSNIEKQRKNSISAKSLKNDLNIKENDELASQNLTEMTNISSLFLKEILLSPEDKQYIESQDKIRRKFYLDKKKEIEKKIARNIYEEPESLANLKKQQKIFEQETLIPEKIIKNNNIKISNDQQNIITPIIQPVERELFIQKEKDRKEKEEKQKIEEIQKNLRSSQNHLKSIENKIQSSDFCDTISQQLRESIQKSIQEINNILKFDNLKNLNILRDLETKFSDAGKDFEQKVEREISEKKRLKEEEELRKKKEEEERVKKEQLIQKFKNETSRFKTALAELKALNEKQDIELEAKSNVIQNLDNESLLHHSNNLKNLQENLINQIDFTLSQIDKNLSNNFIKSLNQSISDHSLRQLEQNVQKFFVQTNELKLQIDKLEKQTQKSLNELIEAKKAKEKLEAEQQRLKELKQLKKHESKMTEEKAIKEKLAKETEMRQKEKEKEQIKSLNQIKNFDENNKAGINNSTFELYKKIEKMFNQARKESDEALNVKEFKLYKFELQKAINFPLNSLLGAENSGANFQDKIKTLLRLLSGQTCKVTSTITVDASKHPKAIDFCLIYLGRKIVEKGEETVASRPETAFEYVQVIMEIIKANKDFEIILMGQLQEKCPYILPLYKPRNSSQTDEQYYESIGYKIIDGKIEEDVHFFKRMSGVSYLYFTLLLTGNSTYFSIKRAWQWLADVLNMTPRPNITAEMMTIFFKCCGYTLQKVYGKQFIKLVIICQSDYLKLIKSISSEKQSNASIGRLINVLEHFQKYGQFDQWKKSV